MTILENIPLAPYTTLRIGGPARWFCEAATEDEVVEAVSFAREHGIALFVLGGGSNLLVADAGFAGQVLRVAVRGLTEVAEATDVLLRAGAGEDWDGVVQYAVARGYAGMECLAGIPGDAGGTPVQNVGAYGQEVAETIARVRAFDLEAGAFVNLNRDACGFGYRRSVFNTEARGRYIVTAVTYRLRVGGEPALKYADVRRHFAARLAAGEMPSLREVYDAVRAIRATKGMLAGQGGADSMSAGSFFKNPVVAEELLARVAAGAAVAAEEVPRYPAGDGLVKLPAAWLLERAGFVKGFRMGRVGISTRHTLAVVNLGGATFADVVALRDEVVRVVRNQFGIGLEQEPIELA